MHNINGDFMKKALLLLVLFLLSVVTVSSSDRYSYLLSDDSYNLYYVSIDNLNTLNFFSYFKGFNVIRVYPYVNPIYKNMIGEVSYEFSSNNINNEINLFNRYYLDLIKKNSYSDYNYLYINGIFIEKVLVYANGPDLYSFANRVNSSVRIFK